MRVRIIFTLNNRGGWVPFHHQYLLSDLMENVLQKDAKEYVDFEWYNFSGLKGQTKVGKQGLHFYSSKVTLVLSSIDKGFIDAVLKGIFTRKEIEIGKISLTPDSVELEKKPDLTDETKYICISPLVIADPNTEIGSTKQFVDPTDDLFSDLLYESTMTRLDQNPDFTSEEIESYFKFQVDPDQKYLAKIRASEKKFSRIYPAFIGDKQVEVRGYTFPFTFYVDSKVQEFIFNCGFGEFAKKGFGMLDLANVDPVGRAAKYEF